MASLNIVQELVSAAVAKHPLPDSVEGLDAQTRRRVIAEAERQGVTPNALLAAMRAKQEDDALNAELTTGVAMVVRARRAGNH